MTARQTVAAKEDQTAVADAKGGEIPVTTVFVHSVHTSHVNDRRIASPIDPDGGHHAFGYFDARET